ncbi:MAG: 2OG-Fe(II) oxygenase [Pyrinomonadaceae bacterium]
MVEPLSIIKLDALRDAPLKDHPFPYVVIENFLHAEYAPEVSKDFPEIKSRGSFPITKLESGEAFQRLVEELNSAALKAAIAEKFEINLDDRSTMITVRGKASARDGRIHTDTKSKFLTMLLYLNPVWEAEGGWLRILRNGKNLDDYVVEIPPTFGTCLLFKVTDNCWHGHKPFKGTRRVLQLNYVTDAAALNRHLLRHNMTAKLKSLKEVFLKGTQ